MLQLNNQWRSSSWFSGSDDDVVLVSFSFVKALSCLLAASSVRASEFWSSSCRLVCFSGRRVQPCSSLFGSSILYRSPLWTPCSRPCIRVMCCIIPCTHSNFFYQRNDTQDLRIQEKKEVTQFKYTTIYALHNDRVPCDAFWDGSTTCACCVYTAELTTRV